ncbi:MAG: hypothetical protein M3174_00760 [Actinomycetota bacterium]|nr:hypothetical protein [Actinomycetota bacterium]
MNAQPSVSPDLQWLVDVLWGTRGTEVTFGSRRSATGESYAIVPSAARARFLFPAGRPRLVGKALRAYNRLRPARVRALRAAAALASSVGAERLVARDVLEVTVAGEGEGLRSFIARVLGRDDIALLVGLAPRGPNRKPLVQVFSDRGDPLAFAKVGWNEVTARRVRREAAALTAFGPRAGDVVAVPELIYEGVWQGLQFTVSAPMPLAVRGYPARGPFPVAAARAVFSFEQPVEAKLGDSPYLTSLLERAASVSGDRGRRVVEGLARVERRFGSTALTFGVAHGDWVPWNLARAEATTYVFDWEHWDDRAPLGLDVFHWHFQKSFILLQRPLHEAWRTALEAAPREWRALGVENDAAAVVPALFLADITLRAAESIAVGAMPNERWESGVDDLLDAVAR